MDIILNIFAGIILADFTSGFIHWVQDRYAKPSWPIVGKAVANAHEHHTYPLKFLETTFLQRNLATFILVFIIAGFLALIAGLNTVTITALAVGAFSNEIHATTHRKAVLTWVHVLRFLGIFQSPRHHAFHHRPSANTNYCVITNYLNPVLDHIGFWKWLEFCLLSVGVWANGTWHRKDK